MFCFIQDSVNQPIVERAITKTELPWPILSIMLRLFGCIAPKTFKC